MKWLVLSVALVCVGRSLQSESAEELLAEAEATGGTEAPPTSPSSDWGSYYRLNTGKMQAIFDEIFPKFKASSSGSQSKCVGAQTALYSRYYQNIRSGKEKEYILSYFCVSSRGYEHLRVDISDIDTPSSATYKNYYDSLSELGISGAGAYSDDDTRSDKEAEDEVKRLFGILKANVSADLGACQGLSFSTDFKLQTKSENQLQYWQFPVACTLTTPNDYFTDVEVFKDVENRWVNGGNFTYVGNNGLASNAAYHILKTEKQSGAPTLFLSVPLLVAARLFA